MHVLIISIVVGLVAPISGPTDLVEETIPAQIPGVTAISEGDILACTYVGGSGREDAFPRIATVVDPDGYIYVAGATSSGDFPEPSVPGVRFDGAGYDAFVAKYSPDLSTLVACALLGGSGVERVADLELDSEGRVYVLGNTTSGDFPFTEGAYQTEYGGTGNDPYGDGDVFIARLSGDLQTLFECTYLGASLAEHAHALTLDASGRVWVAGGTQSNDFPFTPGVYDSTHSSGGTFALDGFVSCLSADLDSLIVSTYIGSAGDDCPEAIAIGADGGVYIGGWTAANFYPYVSGCADTSYNGGAYDAFVSKFSSDLTALEASTFLGGALWDFVYDLTLDESGNVYVTGHTASIGSFPYTPGAYDSTYNGVVGQGTTDDGFLSKYDADLTTLLASTFYGGHGWEMGFALAIDQWGGVCVVGHTDSEGFPTSTPTYRGTYIGGQNDLTVSRLNADLTELTFSTFLGGTNRDWYAGMAFDASGNIVAAALTLSSNVPFSTTAHDTSYSGNTDAFVTIVPHEYFTDVDDDSVLDIVDNCPTVPNPDQDDGDGDSVGDLCDLCPGHDDLSDGDGDAVPDGCDDCTDTDADGYGNSGYPANTCAADNCPDEYNPGQEDNDLDGVGNACCCVERSGNVDDDPDGLVDIGDLTALITYLYISGTPLDCPAAGNVDGDTSGLVDIGDLTAMIGYLYIPPNIPPALCQ
jgi:hypothetical protein